MQKSSILIIGGSGFIGHYIIQEALSWGFEVHTTTRKTSDTSNFQDSNVTIHSIDFERPDSLDELFAHHDYQYIIHNIGLTKANTFNEYREVNAIYIQMVLDALTRHGRMPKRFVMVSSLAAYGPADFQPNGKVSNESVPRPVTMYGKSKLEGEKILENNKIIDYTIIRPTAVYGPRERDLFSLFKIINKNIEPSIGLLPQKLTFVYVEDLAKAILLATTAVRSKNKAYFITDGHTYTGDAFGGFIKEALGKRTIKFKIPIICIKLIAAISEMTHKNSQKVPALNKEKVHELKARNWSVDISESIQDLNFMPQVPLNEGIQKTIDWYKTNNWL